MSRWCAPLLLAAATALAQGSPTDEARLPRARVSLFGGGSLRNTALRHEGFPTATVGGFSPTHLNLNAAWFFLPWVGADVDVAASFFAAQYTDGTERKVPLTGFAAAPSLAGRWAPLSWLRLEGAAGYQLLLEPMMLAALEVRSTALFLHGPSLRAAVGLSYGRFDATLFVRGTFAVGASLDATPARGSAMEAGLRAGVAFFETDTLRFSAMARLGYRGAAGNVTPFSASARAFDVGLGLEASLLPPPAPKPVVVKPSPRLRVVVTVSGQPAKGAVVTVGGGAPRTVDAEGAVSLSVERGDTEVKVKLSGFEDAKVRVTVSTDAPPPVRVELQPLTGPGTIRGTVKGDDGAPLPGVTVSAASGVKTTSDDKGAFVLSQMGPGVVALTFVLEAYALKEELVQVPPGGESTVAVALVRSTEPLKATLRGSIRSTMGKSVGAVVRISNYKGKVKVNAEGRFEVQLEAGTYTLTISAPKHVTQTKSVTVAPGDQAIFQVDLQPAGR